MLIPIDLPPQKNNRLVWATTIDFVEKMMDTWATGETIRVHDVSEDLTLPVITVIFLDVTY